MPFAKGQSGNPNGRPKMTPAQRLAFKLRAKAQPEIVRELLAIARGDDSEAKTADRLVALKALLQDLPMEIDLKTDAKQMSKEELIALGFGALAQMRKEPK